MASNRHLGRIVALQTLYEVEFRRECQDGRLDPAEVLERNIGRYSETIDDKQFVRTLAEGVQKTVEQLDKIIAPVAPEWPIQQIARVDRNVLRMAVWELKYGVDAPPKVVINEAVELAKAFGGDNSSKFINGVLGTVYRQLSKSKKKSSKKTKVTKPRPAKKITRAGKRLKQS